LSKKSPPSPRRTPRARAGLARVEPVRGAGGADEHAVARAAAATALPQGVARGGESGGVESGGVVAAVVAGRRGAVVPDGPRVAAAPAELPRLHRPLRAGERPELAVDVVARAESQTIRDTV